MDMSGLLRPNDLNQISSDAEMAKMDEERQYKKKKELQEQELHAAFLSRDIHPEVFDRINNAVRIAAKNGKQRLQVVTFPCSFCSDGGRRINIGDPEWPSTLEGFAKRAYDFFVKELRPLGYKVSAEIISYPGGMPGEAALILKW
jgi:hypothetical protein